MKQLLQNPAPVSITACDTIRYRNVIATILKYAPMTEESYLMMFFELGCKLVETKFKGDQQLIDKLLKDVNYGFWAWFLIEYMRHDEALQNSKIPYRKYDSYKELWLSTFRLQNALDNYCINTSY